MPFALAALALISAGPKWTYPVGGYQIEKWVNEQQEMETVRLKDRHGRFITSFQDFRVRTRLRRWKPKSNPIVQVDCYSGGAHGSLRYFLWELGARPKCLLAYNKNNVSDRQDFDLVDLDRDGIPEIRSWYDGYAYLIGASYWPDLPIILKLEGGRFVEKTARYPKIVRAAQTELWKQHRQADPKEPLRNRSELTSISAQLLALSTITHSRSSTIRRLNRTLPPAHRHWLTTHARAIETIFDLRSLRYAYPKAYQRTTPSFGRQNDRLTKAAQSFDN